MSEEKRASGDFLLGIEERTIDERANKDEPRNLRNKLPRATLPVFPKQNDDSRSNLTQRVAIRPPERKRKYIHKDTANYRGRRLV